MSSIPLEGMNMMSNAFGAALKQMRNELGLSQLALAGIIGSTQRHLSFLETGRALPSRAMIGRLATELNLSAAQRATLFDTSGFRNPYKKRAPDSAEIEQALDLIEMRLLAHWPFPGFVIDASWTVLRMNDQARMMFAGQIKDEAHDLNAFSLFLAEEFRARVENWAQASIALYFRMQSEATQSQVIADAFKKAQKQGIFNHVAEHLIQSDEMPIFVPMILKMPDGSRLSLTSMLGHLASVHDAVVEGLKVELIMPIDAQSEEKLLAMNSP